MATGVAGAYHQTRQVDAALVAGEVGLGYGTEHPGMAEPVLPLGHAKGTKDRQSAMDEESLA